MLPDGSDATSSGLLKHEAVLVLLQLALAVKVDWPSTKSAVVSPAEPGVPGVPPPGADGLRYPSTRVLKSSTTHRLSNLSTATPFGSAIRVALVPQVSVVKLPFS